MLCTQVTNIWKDPEDRSPAAVEVVTTNTETDQTTTKTFKTLRAAAAHARKAPAGAWIQWPNGNTETIKTPLFIGTTPICKTNYSKEIDMKQTVRAIENKNGKFVLAAEDDFEPQEGVEHDTVESAMEDAALMWPSNSVWKGQRVTDGWEIEIN